MTARRAVNTNRQGANFELQIMKDLDRFGYTTMRSSGSRGAVDVVAIARDEVLLIQAKISNPLLPPKGRKAVTALALHLPAVSVPLVAYRVRGKVCYRLLTGTGPKDWMLWEPEPTREAVCSCGHVKGLHADATGCWWMDMNHSADCKCQGFELEG
jgi:hypothetical protein